MHRRKGVKGQQPGVDGPAAVPAATPKQAAAPKQQAAKAPETAAAAAGKQHATATSQAAGAHAAAFVLDLVLLVYCHAAAVRLLAPQTGEWLAGSFCSLTLFAVAAVAAVAGLVAEAAAGAARSNFLPAITGWWLAAAAAGVTALLRPGSLVGSLLLAPGLADGSGAKITDTELTLRCMGLAAAAYGLLFGALGFAAGACGTRAVHALLPGAPVLLLLLPVLLGTAGAAMLCGLPAAALPPWPGATLPPAVLAVAAAAAATLTPGAPAASRRAKDGKGGTGRSGRSGSAAASSGDRRQTAVVAACAAAVAAAVLVGSAVRQPCSTAPHQLDGGRYTVLWQCSMAAGGQLSVVEGMYNEQYRYRLLRLDHSVMGGEYVAPADVAGQSIYTAFYLQQAAALLRPNGSLSLHVGLGIGTAVKGFQRLGVAADVLELHAEVLTAAQRYFGLQPGLHGGHAVVGDAAALVPQMAHAAAEASGSTGRRYDYVLHDVFSGGSTATLLMDAPFFRLLDATLAPGGVLAVNYYGGKGQGLKQAWCRLRLVFDHVRAFSDVEKARVRNHVLFASNSDLSAVNLTAAVLAAEAQAAPAAVENAAGTAAAGAAAPGSGSGVQAAPEVLDPLQLQVWRGLPKQEVQLTFDRQRCQAMLQWHNGMAPRAAPASASSSKGGLKQGRGRGQAATAGQPLPWLLRQVRAARERHSLAAAHWVAMRQQFSDAFWLA